MSLEAVAIFCVAAAAADGNCTRLKMGSLPLVKKLTALIFALVLFSLHIFYSYFSFLSFPIVCAENCSRGSGVSELLFDSPFLSPLSFFCLILLRFQSCPFSSNGPFSDSSAFRYFVLDIPSYFLGIFYYERDFFCMTL